MQVPQELSTLTQLEVLNLLSNYVHAEHPVQDQEKMRVTEQGCRFLLSFKALKHLYLPVTKEEHAALAGFKADMCIRHGHNVLDLVLSEGKNVAYKQSADADADAS